MWQHWKTHNIMNYPVSKWDCRSELQTWNMLTLSCFPQLVFQHALEENHLKTKNQYSSLKHYYPQSMKTSKIEWKVGKGEFIVIKI